MFKSVFFDGYGVFFFIDRNHAKSALFCCLYHIFGQPDSNDVAASVKLGLGMSKRADSLSCKKWLELMKSGVLLVELVHLRAKTANNQHIL